MAVSNVYLLHGINTPNNFYSQVEDHTNTPGIDQMLASGAGFPEPLFRGVRGLKPMVTFRTTQLDLLLAECGLFGADESSGNVDLYYVAATNLGTRQASGSTVHYRFRLNKAFMYLKSLSASHQQRGTAEVEICAVYDGTNPPIVPLGTAALAGTPAAGNFFALGPQAVNDDTLAGIQSLSLDLGVELIRHGDQSDPYDSFIGVKKINPVLTLNGLDAAPWTDYGLQGLPLTSLTSYLRRQSPLSNGGVAYTANASNVHISLTAASGLLTVSQSRGGGDGEVTTGLVIGLVSPDGSTAPLTINTPTSIS